MKITKAELKRLIKNMIVEESLESSVRLYRGLEQELDLNYDLSVTDAVHGYSTWTDSEELARAYVGEDGFVHYIDLPISKQGENAIDEDPTSKTYGDRELFYFNDKPAHINGITGNEALIYNHHADFSKYEIKEVIRA